MAFLKVLKGTGLEEHIDLDAARCLLGRHPSCHVIVEANSVSRQHAQIVWDGDKYLIEDLRSRNGTYLNDRRVVGKQNLGDGDQIKICDFVFVFNRGVVQQSLPGTINSTPVFQASLTDEILQEGRTNELAQITARLELTQSGSSQLIAISAENRLKTLIDITKALSRTLVLEEVLPKVLESLFGIFVQAERGFVFLLGDDGQLTARWYLTRNPKERKEELRVSRTVIKHVMDLQEAIVSIDAANDQRFDLSQSIAAHHVRSIMCAPIIDGDGRSIGCIQIDTFSMNARFKDADLEVLATVGMQAGVAIENARLMEEALQRREVERDLELAHEVQHGILPHELPKLDSYDFYNYYQPAQQIGGDYFDYIPLRDGRLAVLVADVVGHGIPAALLMVKFSAEARFALATHSRTSEAIEALNETISRLSIERFVTMVVAVIDPRTHTVSFVNAGHNPPLIRSADGRNTELDREYSGMPIGIDPGLEYQEQQIELGVGDSIVMFTDGLTESVNDQDEEYGNDRLQNVPVQRGETVPPGTSVSDLLNSDRTQSTLLAAELGDSIMSDVKQFTAGRHFIDDVCLVCFTRCR